MLYEANGMEWYEMVTGLEEHIWATRASRIQSRFNWALKARYEVSGKSVPEAEQWEVLRWAAECEEATQ